MVVCPSSRVKNVLCREHVKMERVGEVQVAYSADACDSRKSRSCVRASGLCKGDRINCRGGRGGYRRVRPHGHVGAAGGGGSRVGKIPLRRRSTLVAGS